jgi:LPXTG-motif cell wall-anchored protein
VVDKAVEGVVGRYTENTMWYIVGGIALIIGGAAFLLKGCCKSKE